jgi:hypothetical protein
MTHLFTGTGTILRPGTDVDVYGDATGAVAPLGSIACWLHVTSSDEQAGTYSAEHAMGVLMAAADTDLRSTDLVDIDGQIWHVVGAPVVRHRPGGPSHIEAQLRRRG